MARQVGGQTRYFRHPVILRINAKAAVANGIKFYIEMMKSGYVTSYRLNTLNFPRNSNTKQRGLLFGCPSGRPLLLTAFG